VVLKMVGYNGNVGRTGVLLDMLHLLTGVSTRHNRAIRDVNEWLATIKKFLNIYDLYGSANFNLLFENAGKAKFDLTAIAYKARPLIKESKNIKGKQISPLILEIYTSIEDLRRTLINPSLYNEELTEVVLSLRLSFEKLQDTLSDTEYR
jgi:hypothetical protein